MAVSPEIKKAKNKGGFPLPCSQSLLFRSTQNIKDVEAYPAGCSMEEGNHSKGSLASGIENALA